MDGPRTVPLMRTSNVQADLDVSDVWRIPSALVKRADQYLSSGDILISSANSWNLVGKCCWVPDLPRPTTFGGFVSVLRADKLRLEPRYAYWWFSSPLVQQVVRSFGRRTTSISNLDLKRCLRLHIPLPPLDEQRHIASVLDETVRLRSNRRASLTHLDSLVSSYFLTSFGDPKENPAGWAVESVSAFVSAFEGGKSFAGDDQDARGRYRVLRVSAVTSGEFRPEESRAVPTDYVPPRNHQVRRGDLLISRANTSALVGAVALVDQSPDGLLLPDKIWRFCWRDKESTVPEFIWQLFRTAAVREAISRRATGTSGSMKNISAEKLMGLPVIQPPREQQLHFAHVFRHTRRLRARATCQLRGLDSLVGSLQQRAFAGPL